MTPKGKEEYYVKKIVDKHKHGCGTQYLVHWFGYGSEDNLWLPRLALKDNAALNNWIGGRKSGSGIMFCSSS